MTAPVTARALSELADVRRRNGLTWPAIGALLGGVHPKTIIGWYSGRSVPRPLAVAAIERTLRRLRRQKPERDPRPQRMPPCPSCRKPLKAVEGETNLGGTVKVYSCPRCRRMFVSNATRDGGMVLKVLSETK